MSADELSKACELDETASYVNVSEESRRKIASIPNVIGDSRCFLCRRKFVDVFRLAMHKCPRIFHEEYKCPDCQKVGHLRENVLRQNLCRHLNLPYTDN